MAPTRYQPSGLCRTLIAGGVVLLHASLLLTDRLEARTARTREAGTLASDQTGPRRVVRIQVIAPRAEQAGRGDTAAQPPQVSDAALPAPAAATPRKSEAPRTLVVAAASERAVPDAPAPSRAAETPLVPAPEQASPAAAAATAVAASASVQTTPAATTVRAVDAVLCPPMTVQYPARALRLGLQGQVQLRLLLGQDGTVREIVVAVSSGHEILDSAAVAAMRDLRCEPYIEDGRPMSALVKQPVEFSLTAAR